MNSTSPITQDPPVQHQASTSPTRKGNPQSKNSKRQSNKKAGKGARWDKWQQYITEPEPQKKILRWGAPTSKCTVFEYSRTQPGTIKVLQYGDCIIKDMMGKFTKECKYINAHQQEYYAHLQSELNKTKQNKTQFLVGLNYSVSRTLKS